MAGHGLPRSLPDLYRRIAALETGGSQTVSWGDITEKPETFPPTIGTTATTAAAGNHTHSFTALLGEVQGATGENMQEILTGIVTRLAAVEGA